MTTEETGSRARTRQAILQAAIEVLSRNPAASLGEIATAAQVGRTTLHRYFAERSDLLAGVVEE
ncbi:TetR family transcriptional regulator, partial [Micromonospora sp. C51]|nr:TetR family transcriptional regulator [Micromonospora sp. C51]